MSHLSASQIINELSMSSKLPDFEKENSVLYTQPKCNERRLSPWLGKRRLSKSIRIDKKSPEQGTQSEKTQQFLQKIFPKKKQKKIASKEAEQIVKRSIDLMNFSISDKQQQQFQTSFVFLPIKPVHNQNKKQKKYIESEKKSYRKQSQIHPCVSRVQLQIQGIPQQSFSQRASHKFTKAPIAFTFRNSFLRKQSRAKTLPVERLPPKKLSINEIYELIGRKAVNPHPFFGIRSQTLKGTEQLEIRKHIEDQKDSSWLIPRSMKNNRKLKIKNKNSLVCKTQYI